MKSPRTIAPEGPLGLGSAYGIELEYMIVDRETLRVLPIADQLLSTVSGGAPVDHENGPVAWSNELALHVIELKTNGPTPSLAGWADEFSHEIRRIDELLRERGAMLLPGAMHPTMDPRTETVLWPHEYSEVYSTYDRIFDCRRHGWANLQSCHINLPFAGDEEFERLHAAVRAVLPLVPALAASSPVLDGRRGRALDNRLDVYMTHQDRIPEAMGRVIPEVVRSRAEYEERIFAPLRAAAARLDPSGHLRPEFLNARGAIARFERGAVELRLLDVQESPSMDLAIALLVASTVEAVARERWAPLSALHALETESLRGVLDDTTRGAEAAEVDLLALLGVFGSSEPSSAGELWKRIALELADDGPAWVELTPALDVVLDEGCLASRLLRATGAIPDSSRIEETWQRMATDLVNGRPFRPDR